MTKDDLITIVKYGGLDDATAKVVVSEIERGELSQSSVMIVQSLVRKGRFTSADDVRKQADLLRGATPTEKARFGSRSEAGRYAANMRWQRSGVKGDVSDPVGALNSLLSSGYSVETVAGDDLIGVGRIRKEASVAFEAARRVTGGDDRRAGNFNLVKAGLNAGTKNDNHIVLKDPQGRVAGVMTVRVTNESDLGSGIPRNALYIETLGTTGLVRGAGTALIGSAIEIGRSQGKKFVQLMSFERAVPFYEKLGFKKFRTDTLGRATNDMELAI